MSRSLHETVCIGVMGSSPCPTTSVENVRSVAHISYEALFLRFWRGRMLKRIFLHSSHFPGEMVPCQPLVNDLTDSDVEPITIFQPGAPSIAVSSRWVGFDPQNSQQIRMSTPSNLQNPPNQHRTNYFPPKNTWHSSYAPLGTINL